VKSLRALSSFVVVLDVAWRVDATRDCPAPGGEPLWRVADGPAIVVSALNPTKKCRNRRLPGLTQCNDFICGSESFTPGRKAANRRVIPGSRLFFARFGRITAETKFARVERFTPKRLPSRRWGNRVSPRRATPLSRTTTRTIAMAHAGSGSASVPALRMIEGIKAQVPFAKAFTPFGSLALPKNPRSYADPRS
jgi:hypothetical protein